MTRNHELLIGDRLSGQDTMSLDRSPIRLPQHPNPDLKQIQISSPAELIMRTFPTGHATVVVDSFAPSMRAQLVARLRRFARAHAEAWSYASGSPPPREHSVLHQWAAERVAARKRRSG